MSRRTYCRSRWLLLALALALAAPAQEEKRLMVYVPGNSFSVAVHDRNGREYAALMDILRPLGAAVIEQGRDKARVRFRGQEAEFQRGKNKAKINGKAVDLGARRCWRRRRS